MGSPGDVMPGPALPSSTHDSQVPGETSLVPPATGAECENMAVTATVFTIQNSRCAEGHKMQNSGSRNHPRPIPRVTTSNACLPENFSLCVYLVFTYLFFKHK